MSERAKEAIDEWIAGITATGSFPTNRAEAEAYREHAVTDLENDGFEEGELDAAVGGDFAGYLLRSLHPDWDEEAAEPSDED